jgi:hypothetical protein
MPVSIAAAGPAPAPLPPAEVLALLGMVLDGRALSPRERTDLVLEVVRLCWREEQGRAASTWRAPTPHGPTSGEGGASAAAVPEPHERRRPTDAPAPGPPGPPSAVPAPDTAGSDA